MSEFGKRLKTMRLKGKTIDKIGRLLSEAGSEFPCLSCASRNECGSFKWFQKWFGTPK